MHPPLGPQLVRLLRTPVPSHQILQMDTPQRILLIRQQRQPFPPPLKRPLSVAYGFIIVKALDGHALRALQVELLPMGRDSEDHWQGSSHHGGLPGLGVSTKLRGSKW